MSRHASAIFGRLHREARQGSIGSAEVDRFRSPSRGREPVQTQEKIRADTITFASTSTRLTRFGTRDARYVLRQLSDPRLLAVCKLASSAAPEKPRCASMRAAASGLTTVMSRSSFMTKAILSPGPSRSARRTSAGTGICPLVEIVARSINCHLFFRRWILLRFLRFVENESRLIARPIPVSPRTPLALGSHSSVGLRPPQLVTS